MSGVDDPAVHQYMAGEDVMTPASALIRDAVTRLDVAMETEGAKKDKVTADREVLLRTMEEVLCLLWNLRCVCVCVCVCVGVCVCVWVGGWVGGCMTLFTAPP